MSHVYRLNDYQALDFFMQHVELELDLTKLPIQSKATLTIIPNLESNSAQLQLNCENLILNSIRLNNQTLSPEVYAVSNNILTIKKPPQHTPFTLEIVSLLSEATDLFGLYKTENIILVKAETEGLRRVFPCIDRPDNLATYRTTIIANEKEYPTLLANGKPIGSQKFDDGTHAITWDDPIPKPSYLFAMVAGNLQRSSTLYQSPSKHLTEIEFYIPQESVEKCLFAQKVLVAAMEWDECYFNLPNPLSRYMIAGVNKYASGASEPMGLNLFNTANLYSTPASRTDKDILRVLDVVAHEYFHTWTGNLVTIRDWFNLCVKEGLTTFRATLFLEHWIGTDLDRMFDGRGLDEKIPRPQSYTAVRSLYTAAAYEKSAEIFRMIMNYLGKETFIKGLATFLHANQGKAVTLEEILEQLSIFSHKNIHSFLNWFTKPGIPKITVTEEYDFQKKKYRLRFITDGLQDRPIPITTQLFNRLGKVITTEETLLIEEPEAVFEFSNIQEPPIPSLLRNFSAPIQLEFNYDSESLLLLMRYDDDIYNQCKSAKLLLTQMINDYCAGKTIELTTSFIDVWKNLINTVSNSWILAELLDLPSEETLITSLPGVDFTQIANGRLLVQRMLAEKFKSDFWSTVKQCTVISTSEPQVLFNIHAAGKRRLKAICYAYLITIEPNKVINDLVAQFNLALGNNMTDTISALNLLIQIRYPQLSSLLESFYEKWQHDPDAINYWFNLQASAHIPEVVQITIQLMKHPAFDLSNPNKVYALLGSFIKNPYGFHAISGQGYQLIVSAVLEIEKFNPTLAASLINRIQGWEQIDQQRKKLITETFTLLKQQAISPEVKDTVNKYL